MLYHLGDNRHAQNIQVSQVIGENEKCVFYFTGKNLADFLANPIVVFRILEIKKKNSKHRTHKHSSSFQSNGIILCHRASGKLHWTRRRDRARKANNALVFMNIFFRTEAQEPTHISRPHLKNLYS